LLVPGAGAPRAPARAGAADPRAAARARGLMARYVAFLRGFNVGGHVVAKDALCKPFTALGLEDVESFIASGNVIFTARSGSAPTWEKRLAERLEKALGYEVATFVRTGKEVAAIAAAKPFREPLRAGG